MVKRKIKVWADGENLVIDHFSGIGHYTAELLMALDRLPSQERLDVRVGAYYRRTGRLGKYNFRNFRPSKFPFSLRQNNGLKIKGWQFPLDFLYGKKIYLWTHYSSWPLAFSKAVPFIYDLSFVLHPQYVSPGNQKFLVEQVEKSVQRATKILTISENSKQEIVDHFKVDPKDVFICYPGVDGRVFYRRSQNEIDRIKAKYAIFDDYIMFLSNLEPRKNLMGLLLAYGQLPDELRKKYALLLVGAKGWLDNDINDLILSMRMKGDRVIQPVDYVVDEDRPALYSGAAAFAYVSHYEGFGIPPLEAMACGTPVVAADNSSLPEAVGDAGVMVKASDPKSIARGLEQVLTDKRLAEDLRQKGFVQADRFTAEAGAAELLKQLEALA